MPIYYIYVVVFFIFLSQACSNTVELVVLQTTDLHSTIDPEEVSGDSHGDWLRSATVIKEERRKAGGARNCLLIDCGDTIQGSLLGAYSRGEAGIKMLNNLNYDAWIIGNHELDFGVIRLQELLRLCRVPVINGNLRLLNSSPFSSYKIYRKAGAAIAVIGMNASFLDNWLWGEIMSGYEVESALINVERILPDIMADEPDMIIAALHQGFLERDNRKVNEIREMAYRFPQIDLFLGGHTHRVFPGSKLGHSWYVQAEDHAASVAKIKVEIDTDAHKVTRIESYLIPSRGYPKDSSCLAAVEVLNDKSKVFGTKKLCYIDRNVSSVGMPGRDCRMSEIICRAISWKTKVPVVFHGVLSEASWEEGTYLDEKKLFRTVPYENGIAIANLSMNELKEIVKEQLKFRGEFSFNGAFGIEIDIDPESETIVRMNYSAQAKPMTPDRIPVAFNSYVIAGAGGRFPILREIVRRPSSGLVDTMYNSRDVLRDYMTNSLEWKQAPVPWTQFTEASNSY